MQTNLTIFEEYKIRRLYDEKAEIWFFSVIDIIQALVQQPDYQTARKYWNKLKERLKKEGSELVTNCHQLKMTAEDGKLRLTDVANAETLLRLIQSVPSPKAEPIKLWLARVGYERMQENEDAGKTGGSIAKKARMELEKKTGKKVVTTDNYLPSLETSKKVQTRKK
jgi:DNA-damage-inducible protein D